MSHTFTTFTAFKFVHPVPGVFSMRQNYFSRDKEIEIYAAINAWDQFMAACTASILVDENTILLNTQ